MANAEKVDTKQTAGKRRATRAQYRKLVGPADYETKTSLQSALKTALSKTVGGTPLASAHTKRLLPLQDTLLLLNHTHAPDTHFFGELAVYKPGALSALIRQEASDVPVLPIAQQKAADGHEYLIGLLYFMAIGNHVIVIESRVRSRSLAEYLSWFLGAECSGTVTSGAIALQPHIEVKLADDEPIEQAQLRLDRTRRNDVRSVAKEQGGKEPLPDTVGRFKALSSRVRGVLHSLGNTDADIDRIIDGLPNGASLEVEVILRARTLKRTEPLSPKVINDLFDASDEDEVVLKGAGGQVIGSIGRLYHEVRVATVGDLLDRQDAERALAEAYKVFVDNGHITPVG